MSTQPIQSVPDPRSTPPVPEESRSVWAIYGQEIATYRRELDRLLAEGQAGRFALIKGDQILGIWDKWQDATEVGRERFGLEPICVKVIDPRDPERFALLDQQSEAGCRRSVRP